MKPRRCDIQLVGTRRYRETRTRYTVTRMWLVSRFSCSRGGCRTRIGFGAGARDGGWAVYLRRRFSAVFLPLAISRCAMRPGSRLSLLPEALISGYFIPSSRGVPREPSWCPETRVYPLSFSRNNKLALLNLSWAAFRSGSLCQQRTCQLTYAYWHCNGF